MKFALLLVWSLVFFARPAGAQTREVDSLRTLVHHSRTQFERLNAILRLSESYQTVNRDTLYTYAMEALELAHRLKDGRAVSLASFALSNAYLRWGWIDSVLAVTEPQIALNPITDPARRPIYFNLMRQKAMAYGGRSDYKQALSLLYTIVSQAEAYRDSLVLAVNLNTIGSIAIARDQPAEAMRYFNTALSYCSFAPKYYAARAAIYTNMANAYFQADRIDSAEIYISEAVPLSRRAGNLNTLATALRVQSNIDIERNKLAAAEATLKEMFQVRRLTGDADAIVDDNLLLIDFYLKTGQAQRGIDYCKEKLNRGNVYDSGGTTYSNNINLRLLYFQALAKCYKAVGNKGAYQETLENIIMAKDSFYEANSAQAIAELQTKYEVEKMRTTVISQQLDLTRKNYLFYGSLVLVFLLAVIAWLIFRNYRRKQVLKMQSLQEEEKRLSREAVKEAEETERKRIAADLHDNLGAYAASILSNIDHIKLVAGAGNANALEALRDNSQTIVSQLSDTIWALKKEALTLTAISDRLKVFIQRIALSYPSVTLDVFEQVEEDKAFTPSQAFHLFNIAKEAITNALKHSGGGQVTVFIRGHDGEWSISIEDNGRGMTRGQNLSESGNGLFNMSMRAREGGWDIQWKAREAGGTAVVIGPTAN